MTEFLGRIYSWLAFIPKITLGNLFEILIISFLIYEILIWVQNTRAWVLLKGGLMILAFYLGASLLRLNTITWMINHICLLYTSDKRFAAGCSRDIIAQGAEQLGWDLAELMERTILAMRSCEESVQAEMEAMGLEA